MIKYVDLEIFATIKHIYVKFLSLTDKGMSFNIRKTKLFYDLI